MSVGWVGGLDGQRTVCGAVGMVSLIPLRLFIFAWMRKMEQNNDVYELDVYWGMLEIQENHLRAYYSRHLGRTSDIKTQLQRPKKGDGASNTNSLLLAR